MIGHNKLGETGRVISNCDWGVQSYDTKNETTIGDNHVKLYRNECCCVIVHVPESEWCTLSVCASDCYYGYLLLWGFSNHGQPSIADLKTDLPVQIILV